MDRDFMEHYLAKPDESLASHTARLLENMRILIAMGYLDPKWEEVLTEAILKHDFGKIFRIFQHRVRTGVRFDPTVEIGHNILSAFFVDLDRGMGQKDYYRAVHIVLNHHHYVDNYEELDKEEKQELIRTGIADILSALAEHGIIYDADEIYRRLSSSRARKKIKKIGDETRTRLLQGYLCKCDYAASAGIPIEFPNDFLVEAMSRLPYQWNELQLFCREHQSESLLISAPTGMGKTEASLLWLGESKGFYVLPLKTAINAIYRRIRDEILQGEKIEERLGLLHGESLDIYLSHREEESEYEKAMNYYTRTRQMSLPLTVTTPDQIFDVVYKYAGYEMKWTTLSYSKIIIDEIQAYSPDLLAYLIYGLQSITRAGGHFAVFTATLPPFVRQLLSKMPKKRELDLSSHQIARGETEEEKEREETDEELCRRLSEIPGVRFSSDSKRHHISLHDRRLEVEDILAVYRREEQKKILVVCNTVKQAQDFYEGLKQEHCEVNLLHAKYIQMHRQSKERMILLDGKTFSKDGARLNDRKIIWIATRIVEASLDIDFDYIFTELTDLSGLFQRLGRCNRKGVKSVEEPNCFVYTKIDPHLFMKGDRGFIDRSIYELSRDALLEQGDGLLTEDRKFEMIDSYLTLERIESKGSAFYEAYWGIYDWIHGLHFGEMDYSEVKKRFRNIISFKVIPQEIYEEYREKIDGIEADWLALDEELRRDQREKKLSKGERADKKMGKMRLHQEINAFCLNVGPYDLPASKGRVIRFGKEEIQIIPGSYSEELGFQRASKEELKKAKKEEESWDAFM